MWRERTKASYIKPFLRLHSEQGQSFNRLFEKIKSCVVKRVLSYASIIHLNPLDTSLIFDIKSTSDKYRNLSIISIYPGKHTFSSPLGCEMQNLKIIVRGSAFTEHQTMNPAWTHLTKILLNKAFSMMMFCVD